jgi:hypothetical protein
VTSGATDEGLFLLPPDTGVVQAVVYGYGLTVPATSGAPRSYMMVYAYFDNVGDSHLDVDLPAARLTDDEGRAVVGAFAYRQGSPMNRLSIAPRSTEDVYIGFALPRGTDLAALGSVTVRLPYSYWGVPYTAVMKFLQGPPGRATRLPPGTLPLTREFVPWEGSPTAAPGRALAGGSAPAPDPKPRPRVLQTAPGSTGPMDPRPGLQPWYARPPGYSHPPYPYGPQMPYGYPYPYPYPYGYQYGPGGQWYRPYAGPSPPSYGWPEYGPYGDWDDWRLQDWEDSGWGDRDDRDRR